MADNPTSTTYSKDPAVSAAEALKIAADTRKTEMETKVLEQDLELRKAEVQQKKAQAITAEYSSESARVSTQAILRNESFTLVGNHYHHEYDFRGPVTDESVDMCLQQLAAWHRLEPGKRDEQGNVIEPGAPMKIIIDSPGGSAIDGLHLFDQLSTYSIRGGGTHEVTITVRGYAASMAGILLQVADVRLMGRESYLMIHEVSAGAGGKVGEIKDTMKFLQRMCDRIANLFVARSNGLISLENFKENWERADWWLSSDEALEYGFIDGIG